MRQIKYILFMLLCVSFGVFCVSASCNNEEVSELRRKADQIKISYKHIDEGVISETIDGYVLDYNMFDVTVKNIPDDFYILYSASTEKLIPSDGIATTELSNGTWYFEVFSPMCEDRISLIRVFLPRFNMYSLDPLCEGVDGNDFALCGKYYEYDVSYDSFKERVSSYRATHSIVIDDKFKEPNENISIISIVKNFVFNYYFYIIIFLIAVLLTVLLLLILKKKRKRGVLE